MSYRVIQWATGNVGRSAIEGVLAHPELELAGCWVHSEDKVGRDVGELIGREPVGVSATNDVDALLALGADCVLYSPLLARPPEVIRMLESGLNVVTPLGWFFPFGSRGVDEIEAACERGHASLHGTGIHPGGITERFPLMVSALSREIRHVRAEEWSDIRTYKAEAVVRDVMLFGKSPEEARESPMMSILGHGFLQSIKMVAVGLGVELDPVPRTSHELALATARIETSIGAIEKDTVAGQRFTWQGTVAGEPFITVRTNWLMGEAHLDPPWSFGPERERFEVEIDGEPPVLLSFHGLHPPDAEHPIEPNRGIAATAMHCVNAVPYVCRAEPGIRSYLDLPLVSGRAHPDFTPARGAKT